MLTTAEQLDVIRDYKEYVASRATIINVIEPMVKHVAEKCEGQSVGVIGTKQTVNSGIYPASITSLNASMHVKALATPLLVPMIEEGFLHNRIAHDIIDKYLGDATLDGIESLVLGCTHYPLIKKEISAYYKDGVKILDSSTITAEFLKDFLVNNELLNDSEEQGHDRFFVSDLTDSFAHSAKLFFGEPVVLEKYQLWE